MTNWVDFKEIKSRVRIDQVLEHYGLQKSLKKRGSNLVGPCPIHKGTNPTQFQVSLEKNNFNCFGECQGGGNVIDFVAKMEEVSIKQAALLLQEWFRVGEEASEQEPAAHAPAAAERKERTKDEPAKEENKEQVNVPLTFALKNLDQEHPYLATRGLAKETVTEFGVGYCSKGLMARRIAIPIHNERGELVAYAGRWPGDPPGGELLYKLPAGFHAALVVFNLHRAKSIAREQGLVLVGDLFDCMRLWQTGMKNVIALLGSALSPEQASQIVETVRATGKVALMVGDDEADRVWCEDALSRLAPKVYVKVISKFRFLDAA
jgi:DNA primase